MDHHHHQQQQQQQQQQEEESLSVSSCAVVPPGFRFHPTEEELVGYYLARKVAVAASAASPSPHKLMIDLDIIQEVDLYRIEPWDLQAERCSEHGGGGGNGDDRQSHQTEWYFFSYKDRKYPSGTRTNRATAAGFWKATGRDKPVLSSSSSSSSRVIGMRKTLVFYRGRAPNGRKTDWIMHEYRLQSNEHAPAQEEGWVVCRAFQKPIPSQQRPFFPSYAYATPAAGGYYDYDHHLLGGSSSALLHPAGAAAAGGGPAAAAAVTAGNMISGFPPQSSSLYSTAALVDDDLLEESKKHLCFSSISMLPQLESPSAVACCADGYAAQRQSSYTEHDDELTILQQQQQGEQGGQAAGAAIDWSFLDTLLSATSQLHADYPSTY